MNYRIIPTPEFIGLTKALAKKYSKLAEDLAVLQTMLQENPKSGVPLGNNCFKIRLPNTSVKRGKSGGFRIIIYVIDADHLIRLLSIYSKSERDTISDAEITKILKNNQLV